MAIVTLLTDFGNKDSYTGAMKGVLYRINPQLTLVDISHHIPQGNITTAAFVLNSVYKWYPAGTIHLIVVDPGVGSERKALCVQAGGQVFIAPDNGVLQWIYDAFPDAKVNSIEYRNYALHPISKTFHGRDIFAPAAAHVSTGLGPEKLGPEYPDYIKGKLNTCKASGDIINGEIVYIDHFGNLISNIPERLLVDRNVSSIQMGSTLLQKIDATYSSTQPGSPVALVGSHGMLEVAVRNGHAASQLNIALKTKIIVRFYEN